MPDSPLAAGAPRFQLFASTAPDLESIAAGELKSLGMRGRQEIGGVAFAGDLDHLYEANLWLRTASRVVARLGRFHASTFYELERRAKKLPWEVFLPASGLVRLRVTCRKSRLYHSDAVAERVMSAITASVSRSIEASGNDINDEGDDADHAEGADRADEMTETETVPGNDDGAQLFIVRIVHDQVEVSADSSGELLHRRGYRKEIGKAPLRETLAAAMVLASGWRRDEPLVDPMCGSGTIPIEAAMVARGIAPGLERKFQFMNWPTFDRGRWNGILDKARGAVTQSSARILGSDRDTGAIQAAARNAERAGVGDTVQFGAESISGSMGELEDVATGVGWILTNPPYGIRIGESEDLRDLYARLGMMLKSKRGWRVGILRFGARPTDPASTRAAIQHAKWWYSGEFSGQREKNERLSIFEGERCTKGVSLSTDRNGEKFDSYRTGVLASINVSSGGVPKGRVTGAQVSRLGLLEDAQNDTIHHGGPERAVCVYSLERIRALQAEGHPIDVGTAGENVTVEGIDWDRVVPGARLHLGQAVTLEVASFTTPCKTIRESFIDGEFVRISHKLHPGWSRVYTRVLSEGEIRAGDPVELTPPPG